MSEREEKVRNFIPFGLVRKRTDKLITVGNAAAADDTKTGRDRDTDTENGVFRVIPDPWPKT